MSSAVSPSHPRSESSRCDAPPRWRVGSAVVSLAALTLMAGGCLFVDDNPNHHYYGPDYYDEPVSVTIDTDQVLTTELGEGVGLFVEYYQGGTWRLWTTCDTLITGYACAFDVYAIAGSTIRNVVREDLEAYDQLDMSSSDSLVLYAETASHYDGITFETNPGVSLEVELVLDGYVEPRFIYWVGNGYVNEGASGTPVIFYPSDP